MKGVLSVAIHQFEGLQSVSGVLQGAEILYLFSAEIWPDENPWHEICMCYKTHRIVGL